ncbi:hypothetical protein HWV62_38985 [Athelia sp. TMB]|nr:hypothetical protein HWV62_38985 [Athelia sp. TMB]
MPGPRGKGKGKSKPKAPQVPQLSGPDPFVGDIDVVQGWNIIVEMFCKHLNIPDLTSRHGLKKVHRDFDAIHRRLDRLYEKNSTNPKIVGGVIGIWSKMCADSLLRDKLFKAECRYLGLRALSSVTHHGGVGPRTEIARQTPILLQLMDAHPQDSLIAELCISTMSHAIGAATGSTGDSPNLELVNSLNLSNVMKVFVNATHKSEASSDLIHHALLFLAGCTRHFPEECEAYPPALKLLVAGLRSKNSTVRSTCICGLIRLYHHNAEPDQRFYDPQKTIAAVRRGYPDHLVDIIMDYGMARVDVTTTLLATNANQKAFMQCLQDRDLYSLGMKLVPCILNTEFSIVQGAYQFENEVTGAFEEADVDLPFKKWHDALPHCARAIRERRRPSEADAADILDIKYQILRGEIRRAMAHANKAIARNPNHAYFYYALTLQANGPDGLRAAKRGLKCTTTTPFVRCGLLQRAVDHAGDLGVTNLQNTSLGSKKWEEAVAFLSSAMEDAKMYMNEAPPDSRHMRKVLYWYTVLSMTLRGPEISPGLVELEDALTKSKFADDFAYFVGNPPANTELRQAYKLIVKLYSDAARECADTIRRLDGDGPSTEPEILQQKAEDDLAAWLSHSNEEPDDVDGPQKVSCDAISTNDHIKLYICSYCGNPSAALRKCNGCEKTRYVDDNL